MKKKIYLIISILIIFNIFLFLSPTNTYINKIYLNISQFFQNTKDSIDNIFIDFENQKILEQRVLELQLDNESLKEENKELKNENEILENENTSLSKSLDLTKDDNNIVMANVMYKKLNTPINIFIIDKGKNDGIKVNQLVTYNNQMVGYISKVEEDTAEVMLLKNDNIKFNIPVKIKTKDGDIDGVIESYSYSKNKIVVTTLLEGKTILEGDKVYSNGYVKNQANNIFVGEITEIKDENLKKEYYIEPINNNIERVEVITNED